MTLLQSAIFDSGEMSTAIAAWKAKRDAEFAPLQAEAPLSPLSPLQPSAGAQNCTRVCDHPNSSWQGRRRNPSHRYKGWSY